MSFYSIESNNNDDDNNDNDTDITSLFILYSSNSCTLLTDSSRESKRAFISLRSELSNASCSAFKTLAACTLIIDDNNDDDDDDDNNNNNNNSNNIDNNNNNIDSNNDIDNNNDNNNDNNIDNNSNNYNNDSIDMIIIIPSLSRDLSFSLKFSISGSTSIRRPCKPCIISLLDFKPISFSSSNNCNDAI